MRNHLVVENRACKLGLPAFACVLHLCMCSGFRERAHAPTPYDLSGRDISSEIACVCMHATRAECVRKVVSHMLAVAYPARLSQIVFECAICVLFLNVYAYRQFW